MKAIRSFWVMVLAALCLWAQTGIVFQGHYCGEELVASAVSWTHSTHQAAQWKAACCGEATDTPSEEADDCCDNKAQWRKADSNSSAWVVKQLKVQTDWLASPIVTASIGSPSQGVVGWKAVATAKTIVGRAPPDPKGRYRYCFFQQWKLDV